MIIKEFFSNIGWYDWIIIILFLIPIIVGGGYILYNHYDIPQHIYSGKEEFRITASDDNIYLVRSKDVDRNKIPDTLSLYTVDPKDYEITKIQDLELYPHKSIVFLYAAYYNDSSLYVLLNQFNCTTNEPQCTRDSRGRTQYNISTKHCVLNIYALEDFEFIGKSITPRGCVMPGTVMKYNVTPKNIILPRITLKGHTYSPAPKNVFVELFKFFGGDTAKQLVQEDPSPEYPEGSVILYDDLLNKKDFVDFEDKYYYVINKPNNDYDSKNNLVVIDKEWKLIKNIPIGGRGLP